MPAQEQPEPARRVLIVEDDPVQSTFFSEVLADEGYQADCAPTLAEGEQLFVKGKYACALVDLHLPDGLGQDLLSRFAQEDDELVSVVLTGDTSPNTVISTLRAGAFDYLPKPVEFTTLKAAVTRALSHHRALRERAEYFDLLLEEREQLRARVEEATKDIRQYAHACETTNARLQSLVRLTQMTGGYSSYESLLKYAFEHLQAETPIRALVFFDLGRQRLCAVTAKEGKPVLAESDYAADAACDPLTVQANPEVAFDRFLGQEVGFDTGELVPYTFTQGFRNGSLYAVGFYVEGESPGNRKPDPRLGEFLDMCARFLIFEHEQSRLLLHVAHQASLGNIAAELARNFVQPLTAIRTAAEVVNESVVSPESAEGMSIISENVERLRRQMQEFQKLTLYREDSVETVRLAEYLEHALGVLSVAIQSRNVTVERDFRTEGECVLLNGALLARTFLDLLLGALRVVGIGGTIRLVIDEVDQERVAVELQHGGSYQGGYDIQQTALPLTETEIQTPNPGIELAHRTLHSCGGNLTVKSGPEMDSTTLRIVLPRNITSVDAGGKGWVG